MFSSNWLFFWGGPAPGLGRVIRAALGQTLRLGRARTRVGG